MKSQEVTFKNSSGELCVRPDTQHPLNFDIESGVIWGVDEAAENLVENPVRFWLDTYLGTTDLSDISREIRFYLEKCLREIAKESKASNSEAA